MSRKGRIIGTVAGVAAAATTAAVIASKKPELKKKLSDAAARFRTKATIYHVTRSGEQWAVELEGSSRASSLHSTKREAVSTARALASERRPSQLVIHRLDGSVQDSHTYDPEG